MLDANRRYQVGSVSIPNQFVSQLLVLYMYYIFVHLSFIKNLCSLKFVEVLITCEPRMIQT